MSCHFDGQIPSLQAYGESKKTNRIRVVCKRKNAPKQRLTAFTEIFQDRIVLTLPILTVSEGNCSESWKVRHVRHKIQKQEVALSLRCLKERIKRPCSLLLTRVAPKALDVHDNLPMSLKYVCDAVCEEITGDYRPGHADNARDIEIKYSQEKSQLYGVRITISF